MSIPYNDALFRAQYSEYADTTKYPEIVIQMYWDMANEFYVVDGSPCAAITGNAVVVVMNMMTAHLYTLGLQASAAAAKGKPGSDQGGFVSSASVGDVSVTKLAPPARDMWQWWLGQTSYGTALLALISVKAVGGLAVGGMPERSAFRKVGGVFF